MRINAYNRVSKIYEAQNISKVKNVKEYNQKMSVLFLIWSFCYLASGIMFLIEPLYGTIGLILSCSIVLIVMYICYRIILKKYS